jgi:hypothetical protein
VPLIVTPFDCDQHSPVIGSGIAPPGHGAATAGEAVIVGDTSAAPKTAAARRREAVNRIVMWFSAFQSGAVRREA